MPVRTIKEVLHILFPSEEVTASGVRRWKSFESGYPFDAGTTSYQHARRLADQIMICLLMKDQKQPLKEVLPYLEFAGFDTKAKSVQAYYTAGKIKEIIDAGWSGIKLRGTDSRNLRGLIANAELFTHFTGVFHNDGAAVESWIAGSQKEPLVIKTSRTGAARYYDHHRIWNQRDDKNQSCHRLNFFYNSEQLQELKETRPLRPGGYPSIEPAATSAVTPLAPRKRKTNPPSTHTKQADQARVKRKPIAVPAANPPSISNDRIVDAGGRGDCLFLAVRFWLNRQQHPLRTLLASELRQRTVEYLRQNPEIFYRQGAVVLPSQDQGNVEQYLARMAQPGQYAELYVVEALAVMLGVAFRIHHGVTHLTGSLHNDAPGRPVIALLLEGEHYRVVLPERVAPVVEGQLSAGADRFSGSTSSHSTLDSVGSSGSAGESSMLFYAARQAQQGAVAELRQAHE